MPDVNGLKKQVDLPVWEWMRFAPATTTGLSALTSSEDGTGRYMYYIVSSLFYRYDTWTDQYTQLTSPITTPATLLTMRYSPFSGSRGKAISGTSNTIRTQSYLPKSTIGYKIQIVGGTGAGQERTIVEHSPITIHDSGVPTTGNTSTITDTLKRWKTNQWVGYTAKYKHGTAYTLYKRILYNSETVLTTSDTNYLPIDSWGNVAYNIATPVAGGAVTTSHYQIESSDLIVDTPWDVIPDHTSKYKILSGGVWLISGPTSAPFLNVQYYCVLTDTWTLKSVPTNLILATIGSDITVERMGEFSGSFDTGTVTSATTRSITVPNTFDVDSWTNFQVRITGGTGVGQRRRIINNTTNTLYVAKKWDVNPDATSTFEIYGDSEKIWFAGNTNTTLLQYEIELDMWAQGHIDDGGIVNNASARLDGWLPITLSAATRNATGIRTVNSTPTAAGSNYSIGDILTLTEATGGRVIVERVSATGGVLEVSLYSVGSAGTYTTGAGKTTSGGTGTGCTINITSVGVVGRLTTVINHNFKIGDTVRIAGFTEALWNANYTVVGIESATIFNVITNAVANGTITTSSSTTVIVDSTANWDIDEHRGKLLQVSAAGIAGVGQTRRITSNTATTLTVTSAFATPTSGTSRYMIYDIRAFGREELYKVSSRSNEGYATSGSTTTLVDSTKSWIPGQWTNMLIRIISGVGIGSEFAITSNDATTLNFGAQTFTPNATTKYIIMDTFGIATAGSTTTLTDTTKKWDTNILSGKRCRITGGTGQGQEFTITSNTATVLTFSAIGTGLSTDSTYTILGVQTKGAGIEFSWAFGLADPKTKGRSFYIARGGATPNFERYDINKDVWEPLSLSPQFETLTTGSMYCYDGKDRIYFTRDATGRVYYFDLVTSMVNAYGQVPYGMSTAVVGNRMEMVQTEDGLEYLYIMRHNGAEMWRTLIFS